MLSDLFFKKVSSASEIASSGILVPDGETYGLKSLILTGAGKDSYASIFWDRGGAGEKILAASRGDLVKEFDPYQDDKLQVTGDGVKKVEILLTNDMSVQSPLIGGHIIMEKIL